MPQGRQGQAAEPTKSAIDQACRVGSAQEPGWLVGCLRLGVGHARNRPARSLHPGRGGRTRLPPRGPLAGPLQAGLHTRVVLPLGWPHWLATDRNYSRVIMSTGCGNLVHERQRAPCRTCSSCREGVTAEGLSLPIRRLAMSPVHRRCRGWTGASWPMSGRRAIQSALGGAHTPRPALGLSEPVRCQVRGPRPPLPFGASDVNNLLTSTTC